MSVLGDGPCRAADVSDALARSESRSAQRSAFGFERTPYIDLVAPLVSAAKHHHEREMDLPEL